MSSIIECPSCGRKLCLPQELNGKEVKCPSCGTLFAAGTARPAGSSLHDAGGEPLELTLDDGQPIPLIPGVPPPPAPLKLVLLSSTQDPLPARMGKLAEVCPRCKGRLRPNASFCDRCGEVLDEDDEIPPWERPGASLRRDCEPHRGPLIHTLGVVSLVLGIPALCGALCPPFVVPGLISAPLGISAWVMARNDLMKMEQKLMDPEGLASTQTGLNYAVAGAVLGGLGIFFGFFLFVARTLQGF